jgi:hypothetical protein
MHPRFLLAATVLLAPVPSALAQAGKPKAAWEALAKFEKDWKAPPDGKPGDKSWQVRMACLVKLARAGPDAVPVLVGALKAGSPKVRGLAAQALGFLADPASRPALERALDDKEWRVQLLAVKALGRLGRLKETPRYRKVADSAGEGVRYEMTFALTRDDRPDPEPIRKALAGYDPTRMASARPGQDAPDFELADASGKVYRLRQFRGRKAVVLVFLQHTS